MTKKFLNRYKNFEKGKKKKNDEKNTFLTPKIVDPLMGKKWSKNLNVRGQS